MTNLWNYRHDVEVVDAELVGFDVEATDGGIGTIDRASVAVDDAYLVVDTGFWILGKKRLIPAQAVKQINFETKVVYLDMSKDEVRDAPDLRADDGRPEPRAPFDDYYGRWTEW